MKRKKIIGSLLLSSMLVISSLTACSPNSITTSSASSTTISKSDMFTKNDLDASYDESKSTKITLSDSKTTVNGDGAEFSN